MMPTLCIVVARVGVRVAMLCIVVARVGVRVAMLCIVVARVGVRVAMLCIVVARVGVRVAMPLPRLQLWKGCIRWPLADSFLSASRMS